MSGLTVGIPTRLVASGSRILAGYSGEEIAYPVGTVPYDLDSYEAHHYVASAYAEYILGIVTDTPIVAIHEYPTGYLFVALDA